MKDSRLFKVLRSGVAIDASRQYQSQYNRLLSTGEYPNNRPREKAQVQTGRIGQTTIGLGDNKMISGCLAKTCPNDRD
jgi:hypothetical protein